MTARDDLSEAERQATGGAANVPVADVPGRYRLHDLTPRRRAVKVLYGEQEMTAVRRAAAQSGLRPAGYVATVALAHAIGDNEPAAAAGPDRQLLAELLQARSAVQQHRLQLDHLAARAPLLPALSWLGEAAAEAERAVACLDELARRLSRRLA